MSGSLRRVLHGLLHSAHLALPIAHVRATCGSTEKGHGLFDFIFNLKKFNVTNWDVGLLSLREIHETMQLRF